MFLIVKRKSACESAQAQASPVQSEDLANKSGLTAACVPYFLLFKKYNMMEKSAPAERCQDKNSPTLD